MVSDKARNCNKCGDELIIGVNWTNGLRKTSYYLCGACQAIKAKIYKKENPEKAASINKKANKKYRENNKEKIAASRKKSNKKYRENNKEKIARSHKLWSENNYIKVAESNKKATKKYRENNKTRIAENHKKHMIEKGNSKIKEKWIKDPEFRIRRNVSTVILAQLKDNGGSKNGQSIMEYLSYSIIELKQHLEFLFEPWMNWDNHGKYKRGGEKKWHIDHIISQSQLPYKEMSFDPNSNFQKCWALENLRPLEAVKNISEGARK
jgi:hypothetical protein